MGGRAGETTREEAEARGRKWDGSSEDRGKKFKVGGETTRASMLRRGEENFFRQELW